MIAVEAIGLANLGIAERQQPALDIQCFGARITAGRGLPGDRVEARTGVGRRMTQAAEDWLRERGVAKVMLMVRPDNEAVQAFYQANGYDEQKRVILAKWLDGRPMTP